MWCHLSTIPGITPHCLVSTEGNVDFLGTRNLVYPAPILHRYLWPTVGHLVHTIVTRGGCNGSTCKLYLDSKVRIRQNQDLNMAWEADRLRHVLHRHIQPGGGGGEIEVVTRVPREVIHRHITHPKNIQPEGVEVGSPHTH